MAKTKTIRIQDLRPGHVVVSTGWSYTSPEKGEGWTIVSVEKVAGYYRGKCTHNTHSKNSDWNWSTKDDIIILDQGPIVDELGMEVCP